MFVKVHKPLKLTGGDNKGSSFNLIEYLDKENNGLERDDINYEGFFNQYKDDISELKAGQIIDNNNERLSNKDTKFYMLSLNPSWEEQKHLIDMASSGRTTNFEDLNTIERMQYHSYLKQYTNDMMQIYANSFTRKDSNDNFIHISANELNYVAKIEKNREYKVWDKSVKHNLTITSKINDFTKKIEGTANIIKRQKWTSKIENLKQELLRDNKGVIQNKEGTIIKQGVVKGGWNHHVHIVVNRQTRSKYYKGDKIIDENGKALTSDKIAISKARGMQLSPNAKSMGKSENHKLNNQKVHIGFHQEKFKVDGSLLFNEKFNYKAKEKDTYKAMTYTQVNKRSKSLVRELANKPLINVQDQVKSRLKNQIKGEAFKVEEKALIAIVNPKAAAINELKKKVRQVLMAKVLEP